MVAAVAGVFLLGVGLTLADSFGARKEITQGIERKDYGGGEIHQDVRARYGETEQEVGVDVYAKIYEPGEAQQMLSRCVETLEEEILGENESLDQVASDLDLITQIPGEEVEVSWELDNYEVLNSYGEIQEVEIPEEGVLVELNAVLTYTPNPDVQALYECTARVVPAALSPEEAAKADLETAIQQAEAATRTEAVFTLPGTVNGESVTYYRLKDTRGLTLIILSLVIGILLVAREKQNRDQERVKRQNQMMLDYPEIVNKLVLFLGAGMTIKRAWNKIVSDYEAQKEVWGERYAYEEMKITCHEMDSGIMESESYERFARRCDLQAYTRLGALLSQNLRRGTKGLNELLSAEAQQAFEERKARARQQGEEAGTKLLLPMVLMLVVVMVIVIVPAFSSMQM